MEERGKREGRVKEGSEEKDREEGRKNDIKRKKEKVKWSREGWKEGNRG